MYLDLSFLPLLIVFYLPVSFSKHFKSGYFPLFLINPSNKILASKSTVLKLGKSQLKQIITELYLAFLF